MPPKLELFHNDSNSHWVMQNFILLSYDRSKQQTKRCCKLDDPFLFPSWWCTWTYLISLLHKAPRTALFMFLTSEFKRFIVLLQSLGMNVEEQHSLHLIRKVKHLVPVAYNTPFSHCCVFVVIIFDLSAISVCKKALAFDLRLLMERLIHVI